MSMSRRLLFGFWAGCLALSAAHAADPVADFYKGKHVDMVIGSPTGGGYDLYARLLARHLANHIPGNPTIVPRNMPGAGTLVAANWLYNVAPKDGTVLGSVNQTVAADQAKGADGVQYDARQFAWIGAPLVSNRMLTIWRKTGVLSIEDATKKEVVIGAAGLTSISVVFPQVSNNLFGTKFKIIAGYPGAAPILLAMERGEVDGIGASSNWGQTKPDWVKEGRIVSLFQVGAKRDAENPDVPLLTELAKNEEQRQVLGVISGDVTMGYPILTTPGVPAERVAGLRKAFDDTMKDPAFLADAQKSKLDIDPTSGEALQQNVNRIVGVSPETVAKVKDALRTRDVNELKK
jgi:tripartite-type tricarboxylate transporter receptor subunit TctC